MSYRYYYSSVKGTAHEKLGTPKQDDLCIQTLNVNGLNYIILAIADGAGTAKYSNISSKFVSKYMVKKMSNWLKQNSATTFNKDLLCIWFKHCQKILKRYIKLYKLTSIRDFATTLLLSVLSDYGNIFVQIGDGAIVYGNNEDLNCVFLPQKGEYANTTHFITEDNFEQYLMFEINNNNIERLAMHTDGIEMISLINLKKPSLLFFNPFFEALNDENAGFNSELSEELTEFLSSERVNKRTNDDKTLVVVTKVNKNDNI